MSVTRITSIAALAAAACAEVKSRARRAHPLPLLSDRLAWVEIDRLVSWGAPQQTCEVASG